MKNLAGDKKADKYIKEELYLAGIPIETVAIGNSEVPYTTIGKLGKWEFRRAWYYWMVTVDENEIGLPLDLALELYNIKHPTEEMLLGKEVRCAGYAGGVSPLEYGANPIINEEYNRQLTNLGYVKKHFKSIDLEYFDIDNDEFNKLCDEGKLNLERYVKNYHIDTQIGLNEFVKFINSSKGDK